MANGHISSNEIVRAANAGFKFLNLSTTLIPGDIKNQLSVLEAVLTGISQGQLIVASPAPTKVKSEADTGGSGAVEDWVEEAFTATGDKDAEPHRSGTGEEPDTIRGVDPEGETG